MCSKCENVPRYPNTYKYNAKEADGDRFGTVVPAIMYFIYRPMKSHHGVPLPSHVFLLKVVFLSCLIYSAHHQDF